MFFSYKYDIFILIGEIDTIENTQSLLFFLKDEKSPKSKITQMIQKKQIIQIKRGLFETDANAPPYALASSIYGPSYLSFEYALYRWDFIHDRVRTFTSAAFQKNKSKEFVTPFGFFSYESILLHFFIMI